MLCSRCNKNIAVVFVTKQEGTQTINEGLCLSCAKELGIKPVEDLMKQMNMNEEDIEQMNEGMNELLASENMEELEENIMNGSNPFDFIKNFIGGGTPADESNAAEPPKETGKNQKTQTKKNSLPKKKSMLDTYGTNLTREARDGKIDIVIGREKEIERAIQILNRRTKNNPVLIGEPGVGKTAIAEGIALKIAEKKVPAMLLKFEIYLLDFTALVAGTQFRGQFEQRLKSVIEEAKMRGNIIFVIDELHNIVGAGDAEGAMSAANILKPALAKGQIRVIGATTLEEYRKSIEKDTALDRRFQTIIVEEPTPQETVEILKGVKHYYEKHHSIIISDEVIQAAVNLTGRYIQDKFFPDKAIDVIDEAGSKTNLNNKVLSQLEILKMELTSVQKEKETAVSTDSIEDYQKAADLKIKECQLLEQIRELESKTKVIRLTVADIAKVIELKTGIPVAKITETENEKLLNLGENLHQRIIGQDKAIVAVSNAIRRSRAPFIKKKRPASFIFAGPTGVGKTELAKALAEQLFGSENDLIRIDMSEYMEKHSVSKIIGAPPGYVGYDDAGQLTEKVRRKPYCVILLDEIEKAHPEVHNILLQILDDGFVKDSHGKMINFQNTIIIMTTNAGSDLNFGVYGFGASFSQQQSEKVQKSLKQIFRPEFLNRVDEVIAFDRLSPSEIRQIAKLQLNEYLSEVRANNIEVDITENAIDLIAKEGNDERYGARPIRRYIQKEIENPMATMYLKGEITSGSKIKIDEINQKITVVI